MRAGPYVRDKSGRKKYIKVAVVAAFELLTRAREWGPELRALEGGGQNLPPPANSAPMKARITKFLWEVGWLNISIMCNFGDPRTISWGKRIVF